MPASFAELTRRAVDIRARYAAHERARTERVWTDAQLVQGFVVDLGQLMRLVMAREGLRTEDKLGERLAHELADCLWSVLVIADCQGVSLDQAYAEALEGCGAGPALGHVEALAMEVADLIRSTSASPADKGLVAAALAACLRRVLVLSVVLDVPIEESFFITMNDIEAKIAAATG